MAGLRAGRDKERLLHLERLGRGCLPTREVSSKLVWRRRRRPKASVKGLGTDGPLVFFVREHGADACGGQRMYVPQLLKALSCRKGCEYSAVSVRLGEHFGHAQNPD